MHARDRWARQARPVREGIVAYSTVRFVAGAGVIAASLLIAGPNPAQATADKQGSSHHGNDGKNGSSGGNAKSGGSNFNAVDDQATALRSASIAEQSARDNVSAAAPQSGSGYSGQSATSFRAPRVVIGNGRIPGTHTGESASDAALLYDSLDSPVAVPAMPEAIEINIPPPLPPIEHIGPSQFVVAEFGTGTADTVTDPLAGVAGLFLIPAIGVVLGYRQARAAQSLRESLRS